MAIQTYLSCEFHFMLFSGIRVFSICSHYKRWFHAGVRFFSVVIFHDNLLYCITSLPFVAILRHFRGIKWQNILFYYLGNCVFYPAVFALVIVVACDCCMHSAFHSFVPRAQWSNSIFSRVSAITIAPIHWWELISCNCHSLSGTQQEKMLWTVIQISVLYAIHYTNDGSNNASGGGTMTLKFIVYANRAFSVTRIKLNYTERMSAKEVGMGTKWRCLIFIRSFWNCVSIDWHGHYN